MPHVVSGRAVRIKVAQVVHVAARYDDLARSARFVRRAMKARKSLGRLHVLSLKRGMRRVDPAVDDGDLYAFARPAFAARQFPGFADPVQRQRRIHRHAVFADGPHALHAGHGCQRMGLIVIDLHDQGVGRQPDAAQHPRAPLFRAQAFRFLFPADGRGVLRPASPGPVHAPAARLPRFFHRAPQRGRSFQFDDVEARRRKRRSRHRQQK